MSAAKPLLAFVCLGLLGTGGYSYWLREKLRATQDVVARRSHRACALGGKSRRAPMTT